MSPTTYGYAAIRPREMTSGCETGLSPVGNPASLGNETDDVMRGLPSSDVLASDVLASDVLASDVLASVNQPKQAPLFR